MKATKSLGDPYLHQSNGKDPLRRNGRRERIAKHTVPGTK